MISFPRNISFREAADSSNDRGNARLRALFSQTAGPEAAQIFVTKLTQLIGRMPRSESRKESEGFEAT
jgi:hypothetical protein